MPFDVRRRRAIAPPALGAVAQVLTGQSGVLASGCASCVALPRPHGSSHRGIGRCAAHPRARARPHGLLRRARDPLRMPHIPSRFFAVQRRHPGRPHRRALDPPGRSRATPRTPASRGNFPRSAFRPSASRRSSSDSTSPPPDNRPEHVAAAPAASWAGLSPARNVRGLHACWRTSP